MGDPSAHGASAAVHAARKAGNLRPLRFRDLRHVFVSLALNEASIVQAQAWMRHADVQTTSYLHHKSRADEADLLAGASEAAVQFLRLLDAA